MTTHSICADIAQFHEPDLGTLDHEVIATLDDDIGVVLVFQHGDGGREVRMYGTGEADPATGGCPLLFQAPLHSVDEPEITAASSSTEVAQSAVAGPVIRYPRRSNDDAGLAALIRGMLQLEGACLYISSVDVDGQRYPVVWPADTSWDEQTQSVVPPVGAPIPIGSAVTGGGGFYDASDIEQIAGPAASARASACVDNTYGEIAVFNNQDAAASLATS